MIFRIPCAVVAFFAICACATAPGGGSTVSSSVAADNGEVGAAPVLTALSVSSLPPGKCGMILWTLDAAQPTPIMRYIAGEGAVVAINGEEVALALVESEGGGRYGVFETQRFFAPTGYEIDVSVQFGLGFEGGSYLESGLVRVNASSGWRIVAPSAGIAGCRNK